MNSTMTDEELRDDTKNDLQHYMKEKDLNSLFVKIVEHILIEQPDEPIYHIVKYLTEQFPNETKSLFQANNTTIQHSSAEEANEISELSDYSDSDSEDSDAGVNEEVIPSTIMARKKRRASICAEKLCSKNTADVDFKIIPKSEEDARRIRNTLQKNVLFLHLDEHQLQSVQNAMFQVEHDSQDVIIRQGDDGDNFYIIESGNVNVYIKSEDDTASPNLVASYNEGDSFGELAIMYNSPRAATCIAEGKVRLWALDRVSYKVILMKTTISKRSQYRDFLKKVPVLSQLTEYEILTIVDALNEVSFEGNANICIEGESGDRFYIIKEGTAICTKKMTNGVETEVARLDRGAYFGEIALVTSKKRQATVTASGPLHCLYVDRRTFKRVMGPLQDILMRNMEEYNKFQAANI